MIGHAIFDALFTLLEVGRLAVALEPFTKEPVRSEHHRGEHRRADQHEAEDIADADD